MAIARDTFGSSNIASGTSATVSLTVSGSNRILIAWGYVEGGNTITGVTYAGVSMTQITGSPLVQGTRRLYAYYLIAPSTGANNLVASNSGTSAIMVAGISYTGAKQTGQPDATGTANQATGITSQSTNVTTVTANAWIAGVGIDDGGMTSASGSGAYTKLALGTWNGSLLLDTNGPIATPALTACGWTGGTSSTANAQTFSVAIAPAPVTSGFFLAASR